MIALLALVQKLPASDPGGLAQGPMLTQYLLVCAGMLALVVLLAFGFRKFVAGHLLAKASARSLRVVEVLPLGARRQLSVVRCYDRTFLLGLGEKEVQLIAELDAGPEPTQVETKQSGAVDANFARLLEQARLRQLAPQQARRKTEPERPKLGEVVG